MVNSSCDSGSNLSPKNEFRLQYLQITSFSVQKSKFSATKTALFSFQNRDVAGMRGAFFRGVDLTRPQSSSYNTRQRKSSHLALPFSVPISPCARRCMKTTGDESAFRLRAI